MFSVTTLFYRDKITGREIKSDSQPSYVESLKDANKLANHWINKFNALAVEIKNTESGKIRHVFDSTTAKKYGK